MKRLSVIFVLLLIFGSEVQAQESGRTDGPEGSEFNKGGYPFGGPPGRFYLDSTFGSGVSSSLSGLLYGLDIGFEKDEWLGIEGSYTYLSDRKLSIIHLGSRLAYPTEPFVYSFTTHAGLYTSGEGDSHFGIAPGAEIDVILNDRFRVGLSYKHDFIFENNTTTELDRVTAGLRFYF